MISWVMMLVSRLLDSVSTIEDEASGGKKNLAGKERERPGSGMSGSVLSKAELQFGRRSAALFVYLFKIWLLIAGIL